MDIYLYDNTEQIGLIDNSKSYFFTQNYNKTGEFEFTIKSENPYMKIIKRGHNVRFGTDNDKVGTITEIEVKRVSGLIEKTFRGKTLGYKLNDFLIIPNGEYDQVELNAEDVIKHYVSKNIRNLPSFVIGDSKKLGVVTRWKARYQSLKEQVESISDLYDLGWKVSLNPKDNGVIFDIYEGTDRSLGQVINEPVVLSPENENIYIENYTISDRREKNFAYVAGHGEGINRQILEIDQTNGEERREVFLEVASNDDSYIDIREQGERLLSEYSVVSSIDSQILNNTFVYNEDYFLGDIVSIRDKDMEVNLDLRMNSFTESFDENNGIKYFAIFGNKIPGIAEIIKQEMKIFEPYRYK